MNTAELIQAVVDAGCEFDCDISYAGCDKEDVNIYENLRYRDAVWVRLPAVFAWNDCLTDANDARLVALFRHRSIKNDIWAIGAVYGNLEVVYDYHNEKIDERVPVSIALNESIDAMKEKEILTYPAVQQEELTHPAAITMWLRGLVEEASKWTKEIKAAQIKEAAKEYEL